MLTQEQITKKFYYEILAPNTNGIIKSVPLAYEMLNISTLLLIKRALQYKLSY